jgi:aspartate-semialdehyde dehydrogenase
MQYNIGILGATGLVGLDVLLLLSSTDLPIGNIYAIASKASCGKIIKFRDKNLIVCDIDNFDFNQVNIVICCLDNALSSYWVPLLSSRGIIVIDNSSYFRYEKDIPLIIPQINPQDISLCSNKNIIANPNCSTIIMLLGIYNILQYYSNE